MTSDQTDVFIMRKIEPHQIVNLCEATQSGLSQGSENKEKPKTGRKRRKPDGVEKIEKPFEAVSNCCKDLCFGKVSEEDQRKLYSQFSNVSKGVQDVFLSGLMQCRSPNTYKVVKKRKRDNIWRYFIILDGTEIVVCQKFLRCLYQVSEKRVRVIQKKTRSGEAFGERRGRHNNRPGSIAKAVWELAREHLRQQPSGWGLDNSSDKRFFKDPTLNIKKLYDMFKEFYRETTGNEIEKLAYKTYHKFFTTEHKYGFLSQIIVVEKDDPKIKEEVAEKDDDSDDSNVAS